MAKESIIADADYKSWISDLKRRFKSSQVKAAIKVNSELIKFYWSLGKDIVHNLFCKEKRKSSTTCGRFFGGLNNTWSKKNWKSQFATSKFA